MNNRRLSSKASNTDNIMIMNMKRNRVEAQSLNYDDCPIINSLDPDTEDGEILKLNRDYLMLPVPIVANPTISNISDTLYYVGQNTLPSIFSAISNIELGSSNTQINIDTLTSSVSALQISVGNRHQQHLHEGVYKHAVNTYKRGFITLKRQPLTSVCPTSSH